MKVLQRTLRALMASVISALLLAGLLCPQPALATGVQDFPAELPGSSVLDTADLLSRAASTDLDRRLQDLAQDHVDARLITLRRLDYGLSLDALGQQLVERWSGADPDSALLLLLIESQNNSAAVVASSDLLDQLPEPLLSSTAISTMGLPCVKEPATARLASMPWIVSRSSCGAVRIRARRSCSNVCRSRPTSPVARTPPPAMPSSGLSCCLSSAHWCR